MSIKQTPATELMKDQIEKVLELPASPFTADIKDERFIWKCTGVCNYQDVTKLVAACWIEAQRLIYFYFFRMIPY